MLDLGDLDFFRKKYKLYEKEDGHFWTQKVL